MKRLHDLDAYLTGELTDAAADAFEEAMFDAPDDPDVAFMDRLVRHGEVLHAHGTFEMGVPRSHVDKLIADGHKVQVLEGGAPSIEPRTLIIDKDSQLIVTRLPLGRTDLARVDVELTLEAFGASKIIRDALVDQSDGCIYGACERALAEMAWGMGRTNVKVRERGSKGPVIAEWNFFGAGAT